MTHPTSNTSPSPELSPRDKAKILAKCDALGDALPIALFLNVRLTARKAHQMMATQWRLLSTAKRARGRLIANPFNSHRVAELDAQIAEMSALLDWIEKSQQAIGRSLIDLAPSIDKMTTLEERFELLNCNRADRSKVNKPDAGMLLLMGAYCVEDSAEHRNDPSNDRPLHAAVNAEKERVMFETPEGRALSGKLFGGLFAPGGLFEAMPRYYRQPDGTMLRQAPPLTVHDAAGSRVVERKPS